MHASVWVAAAVIILSGGCNLSPVNEPKTETISVQIARQNSETIEDIADRTADDIELGNFVFQQLKKTMDDKKFAETIRKKAIEIRGDEIESKPEPGILDLLIENSEHFCLGLISLYCIILAIVKGRKNEKIIIKLVTLLLLVMKNDRIRAWVEEKSLRLSAKQLRKQGKKKNDKHK